MKPFACLLTLILMSCIEYTIYLLERAHYHHISFTSQMTSLIRSRIPSGSYMPRSEERYKIKSLSSSISKDMD